jgi:hypothetical protein
MILVRFSETWPYRRAEWLLAVVTLSIGIVYAFDSPLFELPNYATMRRVMPQSWWATWALLVGVVRLAALYINGAWRPSPHFRAAGSFLSCFLWGTLFLGAASAPFYGVTVAIWPWFLLFDAFAFLDSLKDARIADDKARRAKALKVPSDAAGSR